MSFELTFSYPGWYLLICVLTGAVYALILYFRSSDIHYAKGLGWLTYLLAFVRFATVSIIALLLLDPLLKYVSEYLERPSVIIAVDDSRSVAMELDSSELEQLKADIARLREGLEDKFDVVEYTFGEQVSNSRERSFDQRITDMGQMMEEVWKGWKGQNVSGLILISDGIENQGVSPSLIARKLDHPVYPVMLGDTSRRKDLAIAEVRTNAIAYLGNSYPVVVDINARKLNNGQYEVSLFEGENKLTSQTVQINADDYFRSFEFQLEANKVGTQQITATVSRLEGEVNYLNNRSVAYIDIIDSRQKIVLYGTAPHPDLGAIRRTLEKNDNYEVSVTLKSFGAGLAPDKRADLAILHQVPSSERDLPFIQDLVSRKIPILFVLGRGTDLRAFNKIGLGLQIADHQRSFNKVIPALTKDFVLFELSPETKEAISGWPPLDVPFGTPVGGELRPLMDQQIGRVKTKQPLMAFHQDEELRTGYLLGEGFWKWSLQDHNKNGDKNASTELLSKTIQFLSVRSDKRKFRVYPEKRIFFENDMIGLRAELYNESYESVNDPDVNLVLKKGDEVYEYVFSRSTTGYKLNAGMLPAGEYSFRATTQLGGVKYEQAGSFMVRELQKESLSLEADHGLLTRVAQSSGGKTFYPDQMEELAKELNKDENLKPVAYSENSFREILHLKWIFFLLVSLLSFEWALRKWSGGY